MLPTSASLQDYYARSFAPAGVVTPLPHEDGVTIGDVAALAKVPAEVDVVVSLCRVGRNDVPPRTEGFEVWLMDSLDDGENPNLGGPGRAQLDARGHAQDTDPSGAGRDRRHGPQVGPTHRDRLGDARHRRLRRRPVRGRLRRLPWHPPGAAAGACRRLLGRAAYRFWFVQRAGELILAVEEGQGMAWTRHHDNTWDLLDLYVESRRHLLATALKLLRRVDHV